MIKAEDLENRRAQIRPHRAAHCGHCFGEGRDAALYVLSTPDATVPSNPDLRGVEAARVVGPRGISDVHCGHCFNEGKHAAIKAWEEGDAKLGEPLAKGPEPKAPKVPHTPPATV